MRVFRALASASQQPGGRQGSGAVQLRHSANGIWAVPLGVQRPSGPEDEGQGQSKTLSLRFLVPGAFPAP